MPLQNYTNRFRVANLCLQPDVVSRTAKLCASRMEAMFLFECSKYPPISNMSQCHISGHSKMSGLLILSQTTIKFPSEFFGPFQPLSIPNINRSSLIARESRGLLRKAGNRGGYSRWLTGRGRVSLCSRDSRNVRTPGTRGPGPGQLSVSSDPQTPAHVRARHTPGSQSGNIFTGTRSPQNGPSADRTIVA